MKAKIKKQSTGLVFQGKELFIGDVITADKKVIQGGMPILGVHLSTNIHFEIYGDSISGWSARVGNGYYSWNCATQEECIDKLEETFKQIVENRVYNTFKKLRRNQGIKQPKKVFPTK